jgi:transcription antitermination factor NusG
MPKLKLGLGVGGPSHMGEAALIWELLYTKAHAEVQAELNLRRQGFATFLPRVREGHRLEPLFPRYIFAGHRAGQSTFSLRSTLGVVNVVRCGDRPARVPVEVIEEIRSRMDSEKVVRLSQNGRSDPLFARTQRERIHALERLVAAGFRVKVTSSYI